MLLRFFKGRHNSKATDSRESGLKRDVFTSQIFDN